jgi:hypothetical protein
VTSLESLKKIFIISFIFYGCYNLNRTAEQNFYEKQFFFLGKSSNHSFQKNISEAFSKHFYVIDEYQNTQTESKITTMWKINYTESDDSSYTEYKTRFTITGIIDNSTYSKNKSFQYDCYLEAENYIYKNNNYVEDYESNFIKNEINIIKKYLQEYF